MTRANFDHSNLSDANLSQAILDGASFQGANLRRADFSLAYLPNLDLRQTQLQATKFGQVAISDLQQANLTGAVYNADTSWPPSFESEVLGAVRE